MEAELLISKEEFSGQLAERWAQGQIIGAKYVSGDTDYRDFALVKREFDLWDSYNYAWLGHVFTDTTPFPEDPNQIQNGYKRAGAINTNRAQAIKMGMSPDDLRYQHMFFKSFFNPKIYFLEDLQQKINFFRVQKPASSFPTAPQIIDALTHLHPTVQQAIGTRFADGYYPDALHKACTALEKAVQNKAQQPAEPTGATLMSKVFSKDKPLLIVSSNQGEQEGYMFLYRGLAQAIRNHYAHNDTATDPARALEWLSFISALFYKLDEARPPILSTIS